MPVAKKGPSKKRKKWFEELLLLLQPEKLYTTGEIIRFWLESESVPADTKKELRAKRNSVQTSLGNYVSDRFSSSLEEEDACEGLDLELVFGPVNKTPYGPTSFDQKVYLGAQFTWLAANHLGLDQPKSLKEVLELRQNVMDERSEMPFNSDNGSRMAVEVSREVTGSIDVENEAVEVPAESSLEMNSLDESLDEPGQVEQVPVRKRNFRRRFRRWRVPMAFAMSALSLVICVGLVGGSLFIQKNPEFEQLNSAHRIGGLDSVKKLDIPSGKTQTLGQLVIKTWIKANDPQVTIGELEQMLAPFFNHPKLGWQAKGHYMMGIAYRLRGDIYQSLDYFQRVEECLIGTNNQREDLRDAYLGQAMCYFYLQQDTDLIESLKKAELVDTNHSKAKIHHYKSKYWVLQKDLEKAINESLESIQVSTIQNDKSELSVYIAHHALLLTANGELNEGYALLKKAQVLATEQNNNTLLEYIFSHEQLWANQMNLPTSNSKAPKLKGAFAESHYFIDLTESLVLEAN